MTPGPRIQTRPISPAAAGAAVVGADLQLDRRPAGRPTGRGAYAERGRGDLAGRLGHAVALDDDLAERVGQSRRGPRPAAGPTPSGPGAARRARRDRLAAEDRQDRRHRVDPGDPALVDERPEPVAVEAPVEHERGAGDERGQQRDDLAVDVEQRQRVEAAVGRGQLVVGGDRPGDVQQLGLGQFDDLRLAGRAGRAQPQPPGSAAGRPARLGWARRSGARRRGGGSRRRRAVRRR